MFEIKGDCVVYLDSSRSSNISSSKRWLRSEYKFRRKLFCPNLGVRRTSFLLTLVFERHSIQYVTI